MYTYLILVLAVSQVPAITSHHSEPYDENYDSYGSSYDDSYSARYGDRYDDEDVGHCRFGGSHGAFNQRVSGRVEFLTPPYCGISNATRPRIVGGEDATLGQFPWMVALGYQVSPLLPITGWFCGGSLISDKHVLTAAHCIYGREKYLKIARVGELELFTEKDGAIHQDIPIGRKIVHENFVQKILSNDIGMVTLTQKITAPMVWPICIPFEWPLRNNKFVGETLSVAGWGSLYYRGPQSHKLQVVGVPGVSNEVCKKVFKSRINDRVICAGDARGGKDACQGDSGGPLMYRDVRGSTVRHYLVGIVSFGHRCAVPGYYGTYARVTSYLDWIRRNMQ